MLNVLSAVSLEPTCNNHLEMNEGCIYKEGKVTLWVF